MTRKLQKQKQNNCSMGDDNGDAGNHEEDAEDKEDRENVEKTQ